MHNASQASGEARPLVRWTLIAAMAVALAGCGVRGSLENPAKTERGGQGTATADSGQGKPEGEAPKPHRGFILDGLIR